MENQELRNKQENTHTEANEVKSFKFPYLDYIVKYAKEKPKQTYKIMVGLVCLSLILTMGRWYYIQEIYIPKYENKTATRAFKNSKNSLENPIKLMNDYSEIKKVMQELEMYQQKEILTKKDSLRIEFLIDKYQNSKSNEKN